MRKHSHEGSALIIAVLFVTLLTFMAAGYLDMMYTGGRGTYFMDRESQAFYAAEAGAQRLLYEINNGGDNSVSGTLTTTTYTSSYSATYDPDTNIIISTGSVTAGDYTSTRAVSVRVKTIPPFVRGAMTINGVAVTKDNACLDGRDHDASGNLTGAPGTYGLSCTGTLSQDGDSEIGGNGSAPDDPAPSCAVQENATSFSSTTPWDILGVTQAWFDANVTKVTTAPTAPFSGITYYSPQEGNPDPNDWDSANVDGSTGILIVHNDDNDARIHNITGTFKGLIIADKFREESGSTATIIGAVVISQRTWYKGGNLSVKYSRSVLSDLQSLIGGQTSGWKKVPYDSSWTESEPD